MSTAPQIIPAETAPVPAPNILSVIERIASDPSVDVERMQALLKMRADEEERMRRMDREDRAEDAKRAWLRDFSKVQAEVGPIVRGRKNTHTGSTYADLADIERIVTPILTAHGFSTTAAPIPGAPEGSIRMRLTIGHCEGHERAYEDDFPLDATGSQGRANKTAIQAKGSTQTYGRRYLKASALDLAFMDDGDGNAKDGPTGTITEDQWRVLNDLAERAGADVAKFLAALGCASGMTLEELPAAKFDAARAMLWQKIAQPVVKGPSGA
ncbi:ERF family protein [Thauera sp.]|uniref:ERF family protein n=1 Tax=Thauera sp. TaxID=1905334 RepID=UPI002B78B43E|nr:ERF family protein [Thauera sp.]HRP26386.1 ERF family protein [Thauera sp.]